MVWRVAAVVNMETEYTVTVLSPDRVVRLPAKDQGCSGSVLLRNVMLDRESPPFLCPSLNMLLLSLITDIFSSLFCAVLQNVTWEGDNNVLCLQTARYLLKQMLAAQQGAAMTGSAAYLSNLKQELESRWVCVGGTRLCRRRKAYRSRSQQYEAGFGECCVWGEGEQQGYG